MKNILTIIVLLVALSNIARAQTNGKTISQLQEEKEMAIQNENYELAAKLKEQITKKADEVEQAGGKTIAQLNTEKADAIKVQDYQKAAEIKEQIKIRKAYLNKELDQAVANEDYEKAALIKKELMGNSVPTNNQVVENNGITNASPQAKTKPVKPETDNNSDKSIKEQLLTFEKKGTINLNYGLNNKITGDFKQLEGVETSSIVLEIMYLNPRNLISPVVTVQYSAQKIELGSEDMGIYSSAAFSIDQSHFGFGGGAGASTNFGLNNSKIMPFALITIGVQYLSVTTGDSESSVSGATVSSVGAHLNIRVGATYYFTDRLGVVFGAGINSHTNFTLGLVF